MNTITNLIRWVPVALQHNIPPPKKQFPISSFTTQTRSRLAVQLGLVLLFALPAGLSAKTYTLLHTFGTNVMGLHPYAALAQGPDGALYGTTDWGGTGNSGQVFRVNPDGTGYTVLKDLNGEDGCNPETRLLLSGSTLYGTTVNGCGTVFKIETNGTGFAVLKTFGGQPDACGPYGDLLLAGGKLYGTTAWGGSAGGGTVFSLNTDGTGFTLLKDFTGYAYPSGLVLSGGTLWGITGSGGPSGCGEVFKMNTDGSGFAPVKDFDWTDGGNPYGGLTLSGTTLLGTTLEGGSGEAGVVYRLELDGSGFAVLKNFTNSVVGQAPNGGLVLSGSTLYGTTHEGGSQDFGTVFRINTDGSNFAMLCDFTAHADDGVEPCAGLALAGDALYGTAYFGGRFGYGAVFKLQTDGSGYTNLVDFRGGDGASPQDFTLAGTTVYGVTRLGGASGYGTVFKMNTDGTGYAVLKELDYAADGSYPQCRLLVDGPTLYGSASGGGAFGCGTLFKLNTNGGGFTILKDFAVGSDGQFPSGDLVLVGGALYGTTPYGGSNGCGTVFRVNTDGSGYTVLKTFGGDDGCDPHTGLVLSDTMLYGTTYYGGGGNRGTVFTLDLNGGGFAVLKEFGGGDGAWPGGLLLAGNTLYGVTDGGIGDAVVFRLNTDGSGFAAFNPHDWRVGWPKGRLCLAGSTLYGASAFGLFQIQTDGTGLALTQSFTGADRGPHYLNALVLSGSTIFATSDQGGYSDSGTFLTFSLLPGIVAVPPSRTVEAGGSISLSVQATGSQPFGYQWFLNGSNAVPNQNTNVLQLPNLQPGQPGAYTVVITNSFGAFTSAPVWVNVIAPVERHPAPAISLRGDVGAQLHLESADALALPTTWLPLATVGLSNSVEFYFDGTQPLPPGRFYRAWQTSAPVTIPSLQLPYFVPAITLTGNIGDSLRLDYINAVGPIDAWVTLDTLTLTNTSQLCFDPSSVGQPPRLYRIVPVP